MKSILKNRTRATAVAGALAGILTLGLAGSASASSVGAWRLQVCSWGTYQTNVYYSGGGFLSAAPGQCSTMWFQPMTTDTYYEYFTAYVNGGGYITGANLNIAQGGGLATGGTPSAPYGWTY
jgi:hypothetical protein